MFNVVFRISKFVYKQGIIFRFTSQEWCAIECVSSISEMKRISFIAIIFFYLCLPLNSLASDTLVFKGQTSGWINLNPTIGLPVWIGARYIPTLNYKIVLPQNKILDFEASANLNGNSGFHPNDSTNADAALKPYRLWTRYSTSQFELRIGLQKINFGSAAMLRPLMWFDQLDPRDPLQITNGVWALLGRYYFLNNANIWLWGLYGNKEAKTWELAKTSRHTPEFGGRIQVPLFKGDAALSCHFRQADTRLLADSVARNSNTPEQRIGLDGKWDVGSGIWFESAWLHKSRYSGLATNQEIFTVGTDYTFAIGNGLNTVFEHMVYGYGEDAFDFSERLSFSGLSFSYPFNISNQLNAVFYHDWTNHTFYNIVNWKHQFSKLDLYFMAYWNPEDYRMPLQNTKNIITAGKGIQIMMVFNH